MASELAKLRILDVSPKVVLPPESGSRVRIFNLLIHLSERNDVRLFAQARRKSRSAQVSSVLALSPSFSEIRYSNPIAGLVSDLAESRFVNSPVLRGAGLRLTRPAALDRLIEWADVILVEFPWQMRYCRRRAPHKPIVLASHNVEASKFSSYAEALGGRGKKHRWGRQIERVERHAVACSDFVLAVSPDDRLELIARYGAHPDDIAVVPNGADTSRYLPSDSASKRRAKEQLGLPNKPTVIYVGGNSAPNWAGLSWVRRLSELTDRFTFLVIGEMSKGEHGSKLVAPGVVNDLGAYYAAADISICPIEFGGGTKIKLLESLAAGLPTLAFDESIRGLDFVHREHVLVVEKDEQQIISALQELADDGELAARLARAGRERVESLYDWKKIAGKLEILLSSLVERHRSGEVFKHPLEAARESSLSEVAKTRSG